MLIVILVLIIWIILLNVGDAHLKRCTKEPPKLTTSEREKIQQLVKERMTPEMKEEFLTRFLPLEELKALGYERLGHSVDKDGVKRGIYVDRSNGKFYWESDEAYKESIRKDLYKPE